MNQANSEKRIIGDGTTRNILLKIEYDGKKFAGWQQQNNGRTVQGVIKEALEKFLRHQIKITGSGRTDAGVHALAQYANFYTTNSMVPSDIFYKLNCLLPGDIAILSCRQVGEWFDSRRSASFRSYRYLISEKHSALQKDYSWVIGHRLDLEQLKKMANLIKNTRHFDNFCKTKSKKESNICLIYEAKWSRWGGFLRFDICANRFLHNMVRLLVGTMMAVLDGKISQEHFRKILDNKVNDKSKFIAPACGLYLVKVGYERGSL
jgi:tRNA pseudouridine38-40 synthase